MRHADAYRCIATRGRAWPGLVERSLLRCLPVKHHEQRRSKLRSTKRRRARHVAPTGQERQHTDRHAGAIGAQCVARGLAYLPRFTRTDFDVVPLAPPLSVTVSVTV
ncbi:hypothetical protein GCM10027430_03620 [Lysobacter tyrosinilyticus]